MYIYSITFAINESIEYEWINHLKDKYIKGFLEKGDFTDYTFTQIINENEIEHTYNLQLRCNDKNKLNHFLKNDGQVIHQELLLRFNGQLGIFSSFLKVVQI